MTPAIWTFPSGLNPTPAQARTWLEQELHGTDYRSSLLDSIGRWIVEQLNKLLGGVGNLAGLSPFVTVLVALVVIALLVWVLPRVRRERVIAATDGAVLEDMSIAARDYRDRAARAVADGRYDDAVLDSFRAITKEMSDRGVLHDAPGRTAHEVSLALGAPFPDHADRLARTADLFDFVRYGHGHASSRQAGHIRELDEELVTVRPLLPASSLESLTV